MPNLHPLIVHFPIALFVTGFLVDGLGWLLHQDGLKRVGMILVILGASAAVPALATGLAVEEMIEERLEVIPGGEEAIEAHEKIAIPTTALLLVVGLIRLGLGGEWLSRSRNWLYGLLITYLVIGALGLGMLALTGLRGGELVYRYGAGVEALPFQPAGHFEGEDD